MSESTGSHVRLGKPRPPTPPSGNAVQGSAVARAQPLDAVALVLIAATYVVVQYVVFPGPQRYDPSHYFELGTRFPDVGAGWWSLRIGLVAPLHAVIQILGQSQAAQYAIPVASAIGLATSVFLTMRVLFHDRILATAAALMVVLNPYYLLNSAYLFPDTVATATFTGGFLLLVLGRPQADERPPWVGTALIAAAGVMFGWTYLIREFSPILLPVIIVAVVLLRYPIRRVGVLTGAAVATFSIELVYGAVRYGNPFEHIEVLLGRPTASAPSHVNDWAPFRAQVNNVLDAVQILPRLLLSWDVGWLLIGLIVVLLAALLRFRETRLLILGAWLFGYWAVMTILALTHNQSGDPILNVANVRYWYPCLPALIMGGLGGFVLLVRGATPTVTRVRLSQGAVVAVAALVLVPGTAQFSNCTSRNMWSNDSRASWDELRSWLGTSQAARFKAIRTDQTSERTLVVYTHSTFGNTVWDGRVGNTVSTHPPTRGPRRLILVNVALSTREGATELLRSWSPVFVSSDGRLAVLASKSVVHRARPAGKTRWLAAYAPRHIVPGTCGVSPYQAAT
jgi:hypothetical protein